MNHSDQFNPRRLIRAIEISLNPPHPPHSHTIEYVSKTTNALWVGLTAPISTINERINQRVLARDKSGMTAEVKFLMQKYSRWRFPAFSSTGYREWRDYLEGKISREEAVIKWQQRERQYARRQLTWFKKVPQITWSDITTSNWQDQLVHQVKTWYAT